MENFKSESRNQDVKTGWEMSKEKTYDELLAEYEELERMVFLGSPDQYEDESEYFEKKYIFEERREYEMKKLEEKLYLARMNQK